MAQAQTGVSMGSRENMLVGINALTDAVATTLGPRELKHGLSAESTFYFNDPQQSAAAQWVLEVATTMSAIVGDGTTTTAILTRTMYAQSLLALAQGHDPQSLKTGIDRAVDAVVKALRKLSHPVQEPKEIARVATMAAGADASLSAIIDRAMAQVGPEGAIAVGESGEQETTLEIVTGMRFDRGYRSPYFITDVDRREVVFDFTYILLIDGRLSEGPALMPVLNQVVQTGQSLLVIAEDIDGEALATLVVQKLTGQAKVCAVKAPGFGDRRKAMLADIAILTGGQVISGTTALMNASFAELGQARRVIVDVDNTSLIEGRGPVRAIEARIAELDTAIAQSRSDYDIEKIRERRAKLVTGVAVIHCGTASEADMKNTRALLDDVLNAIEAAKEEGTVPGGGVALIRAQAALDGLPMNNEAEQAGVEVVRQALEEPCGWIASNVGVDRAVALDTIKSAHGAHGLNAATHRYENLTRAGIVDLTKAVRIALETAASAAWLLLTDDRVLTQSKPIVGPAGPSAAPSATASHVEVPSCRACGKPMRPGEKFCTSCGAKAVLADSTVAPGAGAVRAQE
ncbi:chaperonin GroEL [Crenobacter cavernae]|uniref:60 kDa chaperonin n=1 Tax=Crenobacter cavernae TaxID=2290923 RepID=A0A345Y871_9NEIS|nr:chaperonin GroEL [Crenobacter cavernae]AXK40123.1 chaperonin GroEL [Crenobacter cavernae]